MPRGAWCSPTRSRSRRARSPASSSTTRPDGRCVAALTERYSGVFTNRTAANALLQQAGARERRARLAVPDGRRLRRAAKSDVADIKQCSAENAGDHILGARFLSRFVPKSIPWIHVDLSAGPAQGRARSRADRHHGLRRAATVELLTRTTRGADELAKTARRVSHERSRQRPSTKRRCRRSRRASAASCP